MQYNVGSVSVTNGSTAVVGTNTKWSSNAAAGDFFAVGGVWYQIASVTDDTNLVLATNYLDTTNATTAYLIHRGRTVNYGLPVPVPGEMQPANAVAQSLRMIDAELKALDDRLVGGGL